MPPILAVTLFVAIQFAIGAWVSRRIRTESDYFVAGRQLGYTLTTFSIFATWFGAETMVGSAGRAYSDGMSLANAEPFGYALCLVIMGAVFAKPLWDRKLTTLADLYRQRFSHATERVAAVMLIPSSILWAAAQVRAFGQVLSATTGSIEADTAIAIATGLTILYTVFGGLLADAITDVVQGLLLLVGLVVIFIAVVNHVGGFGQISAALSDPERVNLLPESSGSVLSILEEWMIPIAGSVLATELIGRIIAARSPQVARRSSYGAAALYVTAGLIPLTIGLVGPTLVPQLADPEQLLPAVAQSVLPTIFYAIFAGALISAILSTVDSTLLVSSALLSHNLIVPLLSITDEKKKVRLARAGVMAFGVIAYLLARRATGVLDLVEQASAFGSAGVVITASFALFTNLGGARTAIATLTVGMLAYLGAALWGAETPFLLSLAGALACYLIGSALERPAPRATG